MFDSNSAVEPGDADESGVSERLGLEDIICQSDLPAIVRSAAISHVFRRRIDAKEIKRLTDSHLNVLNDPAIDKLLDRRRSALTPYTGSFLTCVLIRLPGVNYTAEIDRLSSSVVHWEWQRT